MTGNLAQVDHKDNIGGDSEHWTIKNDILDIKKESQ